jgi:hypothetical protein
MPLPDEYGGDVNGIDCQLVLKMNILDRAETVYFLVFFFRKRYN